MNTADLTAKQSTILNIVVLEDCIGGTSTEMSLKQQIEHIVRNTSDITPKAADSQLRVLVKKGWLRKADSGMFLPTPAALEQLDNEIDASPERATIERGARIEMHRDLISAELSHMTRDDLTEMIIEDADLKAKVEQSAVDQQFAAMTAELTFSDAKRITKHSSCAHAATKAARAKCRRAAAKRDAN